MAEVSRVILNQGQTQTTLIDLQEDTVTPDKVLYGYKFHQKNGEVKTGTYVAPTLGTKSITENGTYYANTDGVSGYSSVNVNVQPTLGVKNATANGTYTALIDGFQGYSSVTVAVPNKIPSLVGGSITSLSENDMLGLTSIRPFAFAGCSSLAEITIPTTVTSIGNNAFDGCSSLTEVIIPISVTSIGDSAFYECLGLEEITIPETITTIENGTFAGCSSLTEVTIPSAVTSIGFGAFRGCSSLTEVIIPDAVSLVASTAFNGCSGLETITIGSGVRYIGDGAFYGCRGVTLLNYNVEYLEDALVGDHEANPFLGLGADGVGADVIIGDGVQEVPSNLFYMYAAPGIKTISIGYNVSTIGTHAFDGCSSLTSITINASTIPALANANAFDNTNSCPIYVPSDMVSDYQSANVWSSLSARIQAKPV